MYIYICFTFIYNVITILLVFQIKKNRVKIPFKGNEPMYIHIYIIIISSELFKKKKILQKSNFLNFEQKTYKDKWHSYTTSPRLHNLRENCLI